MLPTPRPSASLKPIHARQTQICLRRAPVQAGLVDSMAALPGQLFFSTRIPVRLRFIGKINTLCDGETESGLVA